MPRTAEFVSRMSSKTSALTFHSFLILHRVIQGLMKVQAADTIVLDAYYTMKVFHLSIFYTQRERLFLEQTNTNVNFPITV